GGVTIVEVNLKFIREVISSITVGKSGLAYLVDSRGTLVAHRDMAHVLRKTDLSSLPQVRAALEDKPDSDVERVMTASNIEGAPVLAAYATIPPLGWHVLIEQPLAEAFGPLYASLLRTGLLLLAGLALAVTVSLFLVRHMVTPITAIQAGAARIAA